jgi:hypothetical protein
VSIVLIALAGLRTVRRVECRAERERLSDSEKPRPTDRPGLLGLPYGNGIVLNTPHGVTAPAPLMLCVPVMPGM